MMTFFDLFIIVALTLIATSLLAIILMFITKNEKLKKMSYYLTVILSIVMGYIGLQILWLTSELQCVIAIAMMVIAIASIVLSKKQMKIAQIMATVALVIGTINTFFI